MTFRLLNPTTRPADPGALLARRLPPTLSNHVRAARFYRPTPDLVDAVNVALAVGAPLLLNGDPGVGKTQLAWYLAWYFRLGEDTEDQNGIPGWAKRVHPLHVRSTTTFRDLLYDFDAVRYFRESHRADGVSRAACVTPGPLWAAYEAGGRAVVLIDEIDKAPRDFPNDLLNVLDQNTFVVPERDNLPVSLLPGTPPPIVVITSNRERQLPLPFLRRCIFHEIKMDERLVKDAVAARFEAGEYRHLAREVVDELAAQFWTLKDVPHLRKKPGLAELLTWLAAVDAMGDEGLRRLEKAKAPKALPALSVLIKDPDDLALL